MKKFFSIFLLSAYLISITELGQLIKLPILVEHFIEHRQKDRSISLWEFLAMHYSKNNHHGAYDDKDMKLPFKSHSGCVSSTVVAFIPNTFDNLYSKPTHSENNIYFAYKEKFLCSNYLSSIWQPPKSC